MSENGSGGGSGIGFFIAFFIGLIVIAALTRGEDGETKPLFSINNTGTSTRAEGGSARAPTIQTAKDPERLSNREIERELDRAYDDLDDLAEELRTTRIWGTHSPYEGQVTLRRGNVRTDDADREYLIIEASSRNERAINITNWAVESYVTGRRRWIEEGARIYIRGRVNDRDPIWLEPGERAYIISGESPVGISFHENMCTGYLLEHQDFVPQISRACPSAFDEMDDYGKIRLDDDECYEFVEDIRRCEIPTEEDIEDADLTRSCTFFLEEYLSYNACVRNHRYEPFFDEGEWYIYLKREEELWRTEREIIKLTDLERKTVDVIEY